MTMGNVVPIGDLLLTDFDGAWGDAPTDESGTPVIRSTDMRRGKLTLQSAERRAISPSVLEKKRLLGGDILVTKSSGSAHLVGASVLFTGSGVEDYVCSNFTRCLRPNPENVVPEYLYFGLQSPQFKEQVFGAQRTTSGLRNLKISEFKSGELPVPELDEQRRIVHRINECLSRVDEIEKLRDEQLDEAAKLPDALIDALIDEAWEKFPLGELASEVRNGWSGKEKQDTEPVRVLKLSCVHDRHIDVSKSKTVCLPLATAADFLIKRDDVFVVRGNGSAHLVGRSAISDQDEETVIFNDLLIRLRFHENVLPAFVNVVFHSRSVREQILSTAKTAAGIWKINQKHVSALQIPVPSLPIQESLIETASYALRTASTLVDEIHQSESQSLRSSILHKAYSGEL
mgnify:CR=1 FL=1|tara:strand:- start:975 stop:2177 length:1203 start_codon:yes stop_codon:yes gene_type:complete